MREWKEPEPAEQDDDDATDVAVLRHEADQGDELAQWALAVGEQLAASDLEHPDRDPESER